MADSREFQRNMLSGLIWKFPRVLSLDEEPLVISDQFFYDMSIDVISDSFKI